MRQTDERRYCVIINLNSMYSLLRDVVEIHRGMTLEDFKETYYELHPVQPGDEFYECKGTRAVRKFIREAEKRTLRRKCIDLVKQRLAMNRGLLFKSREKYGYIDELYNNCKISCMEQGVPATMFDEIWQQACAERRVNEQERVRRALKTKY